MFRIPLSATPIDSAALAAVLDTYKDRPLMQVVADFETKIREYTGAKYVLALNSGTSAIHLGLKALGVGQGDCVIAPTFTYVATINPIIYLGASPILVDSEPETWNMDPVLLEKAIVEQLKRGKRPKCVIVVHGYGMPARLDAIMEVCNRFEISVLEDAAEAIGSKYKGRQVGTFGRVGVLSFNNNKVLTTYGGGAMMTQDEGIYQKAVLWASQSREDKPYYEHKDIGFNYRMGPLNAAAGLVGMLEIDQKINARRASFAGYVSALKSWPKVKGWLDKSADSFSNRWLSTLTVKGLNISELIASMNGQGIECRRLWNPMHQQPLYRSCPAELNGLSEHLFQTGLCLPHCSLDDISTVERALRQSP